MVEKDFRNFYYTSITRNRRLESYRHFCGRVHVTVCYQPCPVTQTTSRSQKHRYTSNHFVSSSLSVNWLRHQVTYSEISRIPKRTNRWAEERRDESCTRKCATKRFERPSLPAGYDESFSVLFPSASLPSSASFGSLLFLRLRRFRAARYFLPHGESPLTRRMDDSRISSRSLFLLFVAKLLSLVSLPLSLSCFSFSLLLLFSFVSSSASSVRTSAGGPRNSQTVKPFQNRRTRPLLRGFVLR